MDHFCGGRSLLYYAQGNYPEAEPLYKHALGIAEEILGPNHPSTKMIEKNWKSCLQAMQ
ncbi:MAG: tetratricopeptide repeat protein [Candidatus Eisenbacteria bacterium]|nr:tetratricopeptide repeat protein [Candidatus Eisenbacteria bacterium]